MKREPQGTVQAMLKLKCILSRIDLPKLPDIDAGKRPQLSQEHSHAYFFLSGHLHPRE